MSKDQKKDHENDNKIPEIHFTEELKLDLNKIGDKAKETQ